MYVPALSSMCGAMLDAGSVRTSADDPLLLERGAGLFRPPGAHRASRDQARRHA